MRANEFIDEENLEEFSTTDKGIRTELEAKGYQYLGKGVDQTAYLEPGTGLVLKVFGTQGNRRDFSPDQKMFFTWYDYCSKHTDNPFLPRFYGHDSFMWDKNRYLMIRTEPLKKTQGPIRFALDDLGRMIRSHHYQHKALAVKGFMNSMQRTYPKEYAILERKLGVDGMPLMVKTLDELFNLGQSHRYHWDLHGGNFMLRSDGTPIINDPWVWTGR